ncbi:MAG TPA: TetR/AcrR family transcriptional regulator [Thermoanaerobaculia bacterium]|nr:TetR/AcrR family transcriptional regulator [Thermoanaerobaculia bacterium]
MKPREIEPKQERSRHTMHRLLSATEALLEHGGLEAATVPAIAKAAGLSVGVVYRRFPDKDMLLREVYLRFFETTIAQNRVQIQLAGEKDLSLERLARGMIRGIAQGYRRRRGLLRALNRYAETHPDPEFRRKAKRLNRATMNSVAALLLSHRDEIKHPDPEMAIEFGLLAVIAVLHLAVLEEEGVEGIRMPDKLEEELVRLFFRYIGLKT